MHYIEVYFSQQSDFGVNPECSSKYAGLGFCYYTIAAACCRSFPFCCLVEKNCRVEKLDRKHTG